jgi:hypothetical protein
MDIASTVSTLLWATTRTMGVVVPYVLFYLLLLAWTSTVFELSVCECGFGLFASATYMRTWYCNNSMFKLRCIQTMCELYVTCELWMLNYVRSWLSCWKVWNPSWFYGLSGLYGFKYANSTALASVFRTCALINWSVLLQLCSSLLGPKVHGLEAHFRKCKLLKSQGNWVCFNLLIG